MAEVMRWQIGDAPLDGAPLAAAIGNFDGVHRGHKRVVAAACEAGKRDGLVPAVITFDPHPREFFRQEDAPFHLADRAEKDRLLSSLQVDRIIHVSFLASLHSPVQFTIRKLHITRNYHELNRDFRTAIQQLS